MLVVDDDEGVRTTVTWALEAEGFDVRAVGDGLAALEAIRRDRPSLVVLDLSLPGLGGLDIIRRLRADEADDGWHLPIIVLSGRDGETDRIVGLDLGADDYLVKPFSTGELAARARSLLRRSGAPTAHKRFVPNGVGVELDRDSREVWVDGVPVELPAKEFDLLAYLAAEPEVVHRRHDILEHVWDTEWYGPTKTLDAHVAALRKKLGNQDWIEAVRGVGFRLGSP